MAGKQPPVNIERRASEPGHDGAMTLDLFDPFWDTLPSSSGSKMAPTADFRALVAPSLAAVPSNITDTMQPLANGGLRGLLGCDDQVQRSIRKVPQNCAVLEIWVFRRPLWARQPLRCPLSLIFSRLSSLLTLCD